MSERNSGIVLSLTFATCRHGSASSPLPLDMCALSSTAVIDRFAAFKTAITVITQKHFSVADEDNFECSTGILIRLTRRIESLGETTGECKTQDGRGGGTLFYDFFSFFLKLSITLRSE